MRTIRRALRTLPTILFVLCVLNLLCAAAGLRWAILLGRTGNDFLGLRPTERPKP